MNNVIPLRGSSAAASAGPLVYTVTEVAELLNLGLSLTYTLLRDGTIPARKLGSRWLIPRATFHTWLESVTIEAEQGVS